jgi:hypothetical protein
MGRAIGAVVAGFLLWTVLWLGFGAVLAAVVPEAVAPGEPVTSTGVLLAYLAYAVLISVASGYACAVIRGPSPIKAVWILALVLLAVGLGVEVAGWALTPVWYHLAFLTLLVPATVAGGGIRAGRADPLSVAAQ